MSKAHGGKRPGAGRPRGSGKFGEKTVPVRIPESMVEDVIEYVSSKGYGLPLYTSAVAAGSPTLGDDHVECRVDLKQHLVQHPHSTFLVRVSEDSMVNAAIYEGDLLVVDRSIEPRHGKIVVVAVDGYLTVKRLYRKEGRVCLLPENEKYSPIDLHADQNIVIWGVVTNVIHGV